MAKISPEIKNLKQNIRAEIKKLNSIKKCYNEENKSLRKKINKNDKKSMKEIKELIKQNNLLKKVIIETIKIIKSGDDYIKYCKPKRRVIKTNKKVIKNVVEEIEQVNNNEIIEEQPKKINSNNIMFLMSVDSKINKLESFIKTKNLLEKIKSFNILKNEKINNEIEEINEKIEEFNYELKHADEIILKAVEFIERVEIYEIIECDEVEHNIVEKPKKSVIKKNVSFDIGNTKISIGAYKGDTFRSVFYDVDDGEEYLKYEMEEYKKECELIKIFADKGKTKKLSKNVFSENDIKIIEYLINEKANKKTYNICWDCQRGRNCNSLTCETWILEKKEEEERRKNPSNINSNLVEKHLEEFNKKMEKFEEEIKKQEEIKYNETYDIDLDSSDDEKQTEKNNISFDENDLSFEEEKKCDESDICAFCKKLSCKIQIINTIKTCVHCLKNMDNHENECGLCFGIFDKHDLMRYSDLEYVVNKCDCKQPYCYSCLKSLTEFKIMRCPLCKVCDDENEIVVDYIELDDELLEINENHISEETRARIENMNFIELHELVNQNNNFIDEAETNDNNFPNRRRNFINMCIVENNLAKERAKKLSELDEYYEY